MDPKSQPENPPVYNPPKVAFPDDVEAGKSTQAAQSSSSELAPPVPAFSQRAPDLRRPSVALSEGSGIHHHLEGHFSHRAPWLRAMVLGANDGLVSVAALMLGVGAGSEARKTMVLAGTAGLIGGALSMACGEYISVASQRDAEQADIEKERSEQERGPAAQAKELEELTRIYQGRGLTRETAEKVATELTEHDVIRAHARDELGIDLDELANPLQACVVSGISFSLGAAVPLLSAVFITSRVPRIVTTAVVCTVALMFTGGFGAYLGGAHKLKAALRVLIGGWLAMGITFGFGLLFNMGGAV